MSLKKATDYLDNELLVDSAIKDAKGQVIHQTYIKKTIPDGTIAKNIGVDTNGNVVKETPASGGASIGGGYDFSYTYGYMEGNAQYNFLGIDKAKYKDFIDYTNNIENPSFGSYGWHNSTYSGGVTETGVIGVKQENVSFVVIIGAGSSNDFVSITQNALYLYDGTAINNHTDIVNAQNKLCYLKANCEIKYED